MICLTTGNSTLMQRNIWAVKVEVVYSYRAVPMGQLAWCSDKVVSRKLRIPMASAVEWKPCFVFKRHSDDRMSYSSVQV